MATGAAGQPPLDIRLLGESGLALSIDEYVQAVAGMGISWREWHSSAYGKQRSLQWSEQAFIVSSLKFGTLLPVSALKDYSREWQETLSRSGDKRVILDEREFRNSKLDLIAIQRILDQPSVGAKSVFTIKIAPSFDLKWQWPMRIGAFGDDFGQLELHTLPGMWPSENLTKVEVLTRENARCELLVLRGSVRKSLGKVLALSHRVRAAYLLLIGPIDASWHALQPHVDALFAETQAGGLSLVSPPEGWSVAQNLNNLVRELSHNRPLDSGLATAFPRGSALHLIDPRLLDRASLTSVARNLGRRLQQLPAHLKLPLAEAPISQTLGWVRAEPPAELGVRFETRSSELVFDQESAGASTLSRISKAERSARAESKRTESRRMLQGDLAMLIEGNPVPEIRGFVAGKRYQLDVFIGPPEEGAIQATELFSDEKLNWTERDAYTLQVVFTEPRQWQQPLQGTLELPREGRSSNCQFIFSPTFPGAFAGRVIVYYRGRVLQTALLKAVVVEKEEDWVVVAPEPLRFVIEAEVFRSLGMLDERRRFDACLVLNETPQGQHTATAAGSEGAFIASLDGIRDQLANINALLTEVAYKQKAYAQGLAAPVNAKLLVDLACEGNVLYRKLVIDYIDRSSAAQALRNGEYLQIVSATPEAIVPLEFVYDYPLPDDGAPVCKQAKEALRAGKCPESCRPKEGSPAPHVCPLGFWGLSKVIERHVHNAALPKPALIEGDTGDPMPGREVLKIKGPSLLAVSQQVSAASRNRLAQSMKRAWQGDVAPVAKWREWRDTVQSKHPVLFVALPHADGTGANISLEISGDVMKSIRIGQDYVWYDPSPRPIVLLLGCDVTKTSTPEAYANHVSIFRQGKAALVLGTVATVLGTDGATVAAKLVGRLAETAKKSEERFGEVLRQVKREAVAESLMVAMCLVSFGDADWYLKGV